ncbi:hypothetical protein IX54_12945 [Paracoccus sanguinis]|nr:hypothetical protein IX54_12945 [Paracoccus sanguinis]
MARASNTPSRPGSDRKRCRKSAEITLVFISAESNRLPERTRNPARSRSGSLTGRITARSVERIAATFSPAVRPVTVIAPSLSSPA